jgi:hypothetical protein
MDELFLTKRRGRAGPGRKGGAEVEFLHRRILFHDAVGFEYVPDTKHVAKAAAALGLAMTEGSPTPLMLGHNENEDSKALDLLPGEDAGL